MRDIVMVVGSGMMGSGIGAMSALAGNKTVLVDTSAERAENGRKKAIECIRLREENELNTHEEAEKAIELLSTSDDSIKTAENARLVIEAIIENVEAKQNLFAQLDAVLPVEVPICSNTSGLRITDISAKCVHPERTVTTHFWLPAHLVPLVEVVMGDKTDEAVAVAVRDELRKWKKAPVLVKRDLPGQLARLARDSITALRATPLAAKLIVSAAVLCIPSYLTKMFVQQRLVELGWPTALLFVPMLLSGLASMLGVEAARRLHPESLRRFYAVCALLCGGGCALVGAAPVLGCIFGCMLVQGVIDAYLLHEDQKLNDVIPSDQRATLISVDSMVYSLLMIPASPLVGAVGDAFGQAGAGLAVLGVLVALTGAAALGRKTRAS